MKIRTLLLFVFVVFAFAQTTTQVNCTGGGCIVTKTSFEAFACSMDFASVAGTDSISLVSVTATDVSSKADTTSQVIAAGASAVGGKVFFTVQAGYNGQNHTISIRIQDNITGGRYEGTIRLQIRNP